MRSLLYATEIAALCLVIGVTVYGCPSPGHGAAAERRYAQAQPIIDALTAYHKATGQYPDRLGTIVPTYLDSAALRTPVEYSKLQPNDYELSFRYTGPGSNRCAFRASASRWSCSGLY